MRSTKSAALAVALMAAAASSSFASEAVSVPSLPLRHRGFRMGRRFNYGSGKSSAYFGRHHNPAGTKLAKQAAKGVLTISRIR